MQKAKTKKPGIYNFWTDHNTQMLIKLCRTF